MHQHDRVLNKKCLNHSVDKKRILAVHVTLQIAHTYSTRKCVGGDRKERARARKEEDSAQAFPSLPPQVRPAMPVSVRRSGGVSFREIDSLHSPREEREADNGPGSTATTARGECGRTDDGRSSTRSRDSILFIGYGISSCSKVELKTFVRTILAQGLGA